MVCEVLNLQRDLSEGELRVANLLSWKPTHYVISGGSLIYESALWCWWSGLSEPLPNYSGISESSRLIPKKNEVCPICEEGILIEGIGDNEVTKHNYKSTLPFHFSVCTSCGSEQASPSQQNENKRLVEVWYNRMKHEEIVQ